MKRTADGTTQAEGHAGDGSVRELDLDTTYHLLQNERRRLALRDLLDRRADDEHVVEMRTLADRVAACEHDTTVAELDSDQRQRVYIGLYQSHLPTLDDHGVIDYEQARGRVELTERVQSLEPYLASTTEAAGHSRAGGTTPLAPASDVVENGGDDQGLRYFLFGAVVFVPLVAVGSSFGPDISISLALLALIFCATAVLGGGIEWYSTSVRDV